MTQQLALFGTPVAAEIAHLSPREKAELLMDEYEEACNDDRVLMLLWWEQFDGLNLVFYWTLRDLLEGEKSDEEIQVMADALLERFKTWFQRTATHPETIRRRRAEIQSNRKKHGTLRGSAATTRYRRSRDGAGPPRR